MFINRIQPIGPASSYKTYQIVSPLSTHFRPASCAEVHCPAHQHGWKTVIDERTEQGKSQAHYIRKEAGRKYREDKDIQGALTIFIFEAGQRCFGAHQVRLDRPETYIVRDGDWRGNPRGTKPYVHTKAAYWVEDFAEHQNRLANEIEKG